MDGSCDQKGAPVSSDCIPLPLEKRRASVQGAEGDDASLEAQICMDFSRSVNLGTKKGFQKSCTFPISAGEVGQDADSTCHADEVMKGVPAYERSLSLPVSTSCST
jgi:hypothetical protein